jgi:thiamine biosynthesis lipoprotein ApbE
VGRVTAHDLSRETVRLTATGETIGHLMDPRKGEPAHTDLLSVSVFGDNGLAVDAASSALFVMGKCEASRWLFANPLYAAVMIDNRWPKPEGLTAAGALEIQRL